MTIKPRDLIFACSAIFAVVVASATAQNCAFGAAPTTATLIDFLDHHVSSEESPCIDEALTKLQRSSLSERDAEIVGRFLEHPRLLSEGEKQGFWIHTKSEPDLYPAIRALFVSGDSAKPTLLRILAFESSLQVLKNAQTTWQAIYRDAPLQGVKDLLKAAASAEGEQRARLNAAASAVAHACLPQVRTACLQANTAGIDPESKNE